MRSRNRRTPEPPPPETGGPRAPGTLFVVATPIGNLEDITLRALRVLAEVSLVAAEDTRRSANLLRHFGIATRMVSLHEHNERQRTPEILGALRAGQSVALISDAGTPGISDPGAELVAATRTAGLRVEPVPGPSAVMAAISVSGQISDRFVFAGFPPIRSQDRKKWWAWVAGLASVPIVFFEAPHRLAATLAESVEYLGKRQILAGREVTKHHEEWRTGSADELRQIFSEPRGEFVLLLLPQQDTQEPRPPVSDDAIADLFGRLTENDRSGRRAVLRKVAETFGISTREAYDALERLKISGE